jgi:hypothetical protein
VAERSSTASSRRMSTRLGVPQTRVWRTMNEQGLYPFHVRRVQHCQPGDDAMRLEFGHWVNANRRLLRLIPVAD